MQFRVDKTKLQVRENGASSDAETSEVGCLPRCLLYTYFIGARKTKQHPHSETQDASKSGMFLKISFCIDYF